MSQKISISVIIPVYNVEPYLRQCLDSIVNQTMKELEIILINDCSKDNSGNICDEYAKSDKRIIVIHNDTNIRQGPSRNKGIEIANGEFVAFIDPDDWVDKTYFEDLYHSVIKNNTSIAKAIPVVIYPNGKKTKIDELNKILQRDSTNGTPVFVNFYKEHCTGLYRMSILMDFNIRYPDIRNAEDDVFLLRYTYRCDSISFTSQSFYYYRQRNDSTLSVKEWPYFKSGLQYFSLYMEFINKHPMDKINYDLIFSRLVSSVYDRYNELKNSRFFEEHAEIFSSEAMKLILTYQYPHNYLFERFAFGISGLKRFEKIKGSIPYKIGQGIVWLPKALKKLIR